MATTSSSTCQVRVGVRIRPLTSQEIKQGGKQVLDVSPPCVGIGERRFTYDAVFDSSVAQQELYESVSRPLLASFVDGYNATIMAYGQTGSGKTFTMGSEAHSETESVTHSGLIPRFLAGIFGQLQQQKWASSEGGENTEGSQKLLNYSVSASFLEVYGEDVHDLLDRGRPSLPLREDSNGGIVIAGLTKRSVGNAKQALEVLNEGTMNRTTAATLMNLTSSRSHAVFTINLSQITKSPNSGDMEVTTESRFTFVDLAGSERMKKTGAEGERAREGIKINEGLLALGNVINALADDERLAKERKVHVPYRQSKLTRLLQDALGGNSQTLFLACISPSDTNASETLSTLHYANRARNIKNAPTKNVDSNLVELQRLNSLNRVLECELIKLRFQVKEIVCDPATEEKIGEVDDTLLQRSDVQAYIKRLHDVASENQSSCQRALVPVAAGKFSTLPRAPSATQMEFMSPARQRCTRKSTAFEATPNRSILEKFDYPLLDEVDPDAEMAILDQLLEMEQRDQHFGQEQKKGREQLKLVEGELAEQEVLLLQLKESLRVYHNMKEKYEVLMGEVQQLESEKEQLAVHLEKAKADPSTGCSASIKKKLEKVEQSLTRARNETRKHRQMYRKAEQEAQKCRAMERKITELKKGRVTLIKKQKEAAAKHKDYNDAKAREIAALKRKQKTKEKEVSKLQNEIRSHKHNLDKRKNFCDRLAKKLKQTETHLMKLVSMRNRDFRDRASTIGFGNGRRRSTLLVPAKHDDDEDEPKFAPINEEVKSMKFMLDKFVNDKVGRSEIQRQYEESVAEYSEAMRKMVSEVKALEEARKNTMEIDDQSSERDLHHNVEGLELRVELLGKELEELRAKLPDADDQTEHDDNEIAEAMIASKGAPVLRTLLMETVEMYATSELQRRRLATSVERKDCALESLENEVEKLNSMVTSVTQDLARRQRLSGEDKVEMIEGLEHTKRKLEAELRDAESRMSEASLGIEKLTTDNEKLQDDYASAKAKLTLAEVILKQKDGVHPSEDFLDEAQALWQELGVDSTHREAVRQQIATCVEDTCRRKLEEASALKQNTSADISTFETKLHSMKEALGLAQMEVSADPTNMKLLKRLEWLKMEHLKMQPTFSSAIERRDKIALDAEKLSSSMMIAKHDLSEDLQTLLREKDELPCPETASKYEPADRVKKCNSDLSDRFLSKCEEDLSSMRFKKARILVHNTEAKSNAHKFVQDMNLCEEDVVNVSLHSIKQRHQNLPGWWDPAHVVDVARSVVLSNGVTPATGAFSNHLDMIHEALSSIAKGRTQLSSVLREIVTRAQKTLLDIVEGELDASEAYASFHDALFRLPPLSQEFVDACITEMDALVSGVETMSQSEIEALTVVWEALNVSMRNRGQFWSEIDDSTKSMETNTESPFDEVLRTCAEDKEQWVLTAVKNCRSSYKRLETRLFKLESIHREVEKLRSRQDSKSRIISLDSELRILSARLSDFEVKKCNKQRLLSKKSGGSGLLKEERYRKQMQGKYSSTLEQLGSLLQKWQETEGSTFDSNLLSNEVRAMLQNADGGGNWVEKRTEFMHLRMVQSAVKRKPEKQSRLTPPRKRPMKPSSKEDALYKRRDTSIAAPSPFLSKPRPGTLEATSLMKKRKTEENKAKSLQASKTSKLRKVSSLAPVSNSRTPKERPEAKERSQAKKRESTTLLPFGNVLSEIPENENP